MYVIGPTIENSSLTLEQYPTIQVYRNGERFGHMEGAHDNEELEVRGSHHSEGAVVSN